MSFLQAEWRKLAFANYAIDPSILQPYVPPGTELDEYDNKCFVSLVGFMFLNTKLLGIKVPFHINFEEVNLRFYVRRKDGYEWKRGVVFIKEIVPKKGLTFVANTVYKENYETMPMQHKWTSSDEKLNVTYQWKKQNRWNLFEVIADAKPLKIQQNSVTEFITEHYWGYAKVTDNQSNEYEVTHPSWQIYNVVNYKIDVDFNATYGKEFAFLQNVEPVSVMLAEGSQITVENKKRIFV